MLTLEEQAKYLNIIARFCGRRDLDLLDRRELEHRYGFFQADVMALFGGSIIAGADMLNSAIDAQIAKCYVIVGGAGHTTDQLKDTINRIYPDVPTKSESEAEIFAAYLKRRYTRKVTLLETKSTNCGNNITNLLALLKKNSYPCRSLILAQDATMQRRMDAVLRRVTDEIIPINFATYQATVVVKNGKLAFAENIPGMWDMERYIELLMGEIPRLTDDEKGYGPRGKNYIAHVDIPLDVSEAFEKLTEVFGDKVRKANSQFAEALK